MVGVLASMRSRHYLWGRLLLDQILGASMASHCDDREKTLLPHQNFIITTFTKLFTDSVVIALHTNLLVIEWVFH